MKSLSFKKPSSNNSYFSEKTQIGNKIIYEINGVDRFKLNTETDEFEILKPDGNSIKTKTTEGLNGLLFREKINLNKVTEKDVNGYFLYFINEVIIQENQKESKKLEKDFLI